MQTKSLLVSALVAASTFAGAEPVAKRKIYFPREVKRQFTNATVTDIATPLPSTTAETTTSDSSTSQSLSLSDILTSLGPSGPVPITTATDVQSDANSASSAASDTFVVSPSESPASSTTATEDDAPTATSADDAPTATCRQHHDPDGSVFCDWPQLSGNYSVASVCVDSARYDNGCFLGRHPKRELDRDGLDQRHILSDITASTSDGASTGSVPPVIVQPTSRTSSDQATESATGSTIESATGSATGSASQTGLLPTGLPLTSDLSSIVSDITASTSDAASTGSVPPVIVQPTSRTSEATDATTATGTATSLADSTSSNISQTQVTASTQSGDDTVPTSAADSTNATSIEPVETGTTTGPIPTGASSAASSATSSGIVIAPTGIVTPSSTGGLGLSSILSDLSSGLAGPTSTNGTESEIASATETTAQSVDPSATGPGTGVTSATSAESTIDASVTGPGTGPTTSPTTVSTIDASATGPGTGITLTSATPTSSVETVDPSATGPGTGITTSATPLPSATEIGNGTTVTGTDADSSTEIPITANTTISDLPTSALSTSTLLPTTTDATVSQNSTSAEPGTTTSELPTTVTLPPNATVPATETETTSQLTTTEEATTTSSDTLPSITTVSSESLGSSLVPISTITDSSESWLPTTIIVAPSTSTVTGGDTATSATSLPTNLPKAITPDTGTLPIPEGTVEIQLGFKFPLNYAFIASHPKAAAQVLSGIPKALRHAGGINNDGLVQMRRLQPLQGFDQKKGYTPTIAVATYPADLVSTLSLQVKQPASALYQQDDTLVRNITQQIDSTISIIIGGGADGSGSTGTDSGGGSSSPSSPSGNGGDVFGNSGSGDSSASQRGQTAGIAVGAVVVSAAYGTAMFIIARRYKRRKQAHARTSSVSQGSPMRQTGSPALMGGALLSRDMSSYGAAGGRDSHGSGRTGRSGMSNSARTAYISPPVAAANSLGWN
ncbi:hypothetical protein INS49_000513 [Diaporthe citri]|uniref:uncharacterized protein n=1 Tax=Diaporthe citri TaxID=83186 RepID=UPI001C80AFA8|nr:uncharacterized protein INS49_000513 [Diaporthe citri]KAG6366336.1 hypothetical protein INS49_000513 [Diaporthe citri]